MKRILFFLFVVVIAFGASAALAQYPQFNAPVDRPIVWFVHGMVTVQDKFEKELAELREIYPNAESVELKKWNSPKLNLLQMGPAWSISLENAKQYAPVLADEIIRMPAHRRDRLILVGHSLGGRIVVNAAAICQQRSVTIRKIILAGSAINNDDPNIPATLAVSREPVDNLVNVNDAMLAVYKVGGEFAPALGTGYLYPIDPMRFRELTMDGTVNHFGFEYLANYKNRIKTGNFANKYIVVPQDFSNVDFPTMGGMVAWDALDSCSGWILQHNQVTGHCRIIDPDGVRKAWGRMGKMQIAFEKVKQQLALRQPNQFNARTAKDIVVIQDFYNWDRSTAGGDVWWDNIDQFRGWKLQQHKLTGHCRILDESNVRRAWGTESNMQKSFDDVKRQLGSRQ